MSSNLENNDKLLKIFSAVRCLSRDQLPRYLDGRLTELERHLVEQHLVDCDLCFDALQVLQQAKYRDQYQPLSTGIQQYIRNSIKKVSHVQKAERYHRHEQKKESLLIYFWVIAAVALGAGGFYLIQQQKHHKLLSSPPLAVADKVSEPSTTTQTTQETATAPPLIPPVHDSVRTTPPPPAVAEVKAVVKKDTIKDTPVAAPVIPPASKPQPKDSEKKVVVAPPPKMPDVKDEKPVLQPVKETPVPEKTETKVAPAKKDDIKPAAATKKTDDDNDKATTTTAASTDEFLYKAAMVYHQQGDLNEAISRYKHLANSDTKYGELSRYQLAVCYRSKGQTGKARRMFKEVVRMNGSMKDRAQAALDSL